MAVVVDCASARALVAEGAVCFDADTETATCNGERIQMSAAVIDGARPILVCGSSARRVRAASAKLEELGLPAWQVDGGPHRGSPVERCCRAVTTPGVNPPLAQES